ncbi:MAG: hypothetical protein AB8G99_08840 [Planctomycetaceae bacterium]
MKTVTKSVATLFVFAGLSLCGCSQEDDSGTEIPVKVADGPDSETDTASASATGSQGNGDEASSAEGGVRDFDGRLQLVIPSDWEEAELSAMQRSVLMAKYKLPKVHEDVELTVSAARGGIDSNFTRWEGQFKDSQKQEDTFDVGSTEARMLKLSGKFFPGFGRPDRENWTMIGIAIPSGDDDFYVKLTGPTDQIKDAEQQLMSAVKSGQLIQ